ncbi:hypothetical protein ACJJTC_018618 [Scirpophaga incertulas]
MMTLNFILKHKTHKRIETAISWHVGVDGKEITSYLFGLYPACIFQSELYAPQYQYGYNPQTPTPKQTSKMLAKANTAGLFQLPKSTKRAPTITSDDPDQQEEVIVLTTVL